MEENPASQKGAAQNEGGAQKRSTAPWYMYL